MSADIKTFKSAEEFKNYIFRQKRSSDSNHEVHLHYDGSSYLLKNWSRTGLAFYTNDFEHFANSKELKNISVKIDDISIFEGDVKIVSTKEDGDDSYAGVQCLTGLFPVEALQFAIRALDVTEVINNSSSKVHETNPEVCKLILELKVGLEELSLECKRAESDLTDLLHDDRPKAERAFLECMFKKTQAMMMDYNAKFSDLLDIQSLGNESVYHKLMQDLIYPYFKTCAFMSRAYNKPRGYAGDFEMMNQIYRSGYEGDDLLGKVLHRYSTNEASSRSVYFRRPYFSSKMKEMISLRKGEKLHILTLACGPAVEIQKLIEELPQEDLSNLHFTLVDLDGEALAHAQTKIYQSLINNNKNISISFVNENAFKILKNPQGYLDKYDFVYSGGLFDYFDNKTSQALVTLFSKHMNPGGQIIIGNFIHENPTKAFCHLVCGWYLIHKTEDEIRGWAKYVEGADIKIEYDDQKINAFLIVNKNR